MSLIARCPACATLFRVVPDQLKISDGWVRCGQCSEVFDATQTLQAASPPQEEPAAVAEAAATSHEQAQQPEPERDLAVLEADAVPTPDPEPEPEPEPPAQSRVAGEFHDDPVLEPGPLAGDASEVAADPVADWPRTEPPPDEPNAPEPPLQDMAFVRQAQRRAFWQSRAMRVTLGVLAGGLGVLLTAQIVFHHRDRIASQVPALRPALASLCTSFKCRLGPPQRIESIAIESSAFTRVRADAFRLSLTLSNQADIALAMPALELTLTDLQDQPVLRRVLQPADLGPEAPQAIAPRAEWTSTLTLAVAPGANPARIVGYRVLAFYP